MKRNLSNIFLKELSYSLFFMPLLLLIFLFPLRAEAGGSVETPKNITATVSGSQVTLTWTMNSYVGITGFKIKVKIWTSQDLRTPSLCRGQLHPVRPRRSSL